jgi:hypothetical protein
MTLLARPVVRHRPRSVVLTVLVRAPRSPVGSRSRRGPRNLRHSRDLPSLRRTGCPYCSGHLPTATNNLAVHNAALAVQWHPARNGDVMPADVTVMSSRRAHWMCSSGHAWQAAISNRARGVGCPCCGGKLPTATNNLAVHNPALAAQWHPTRNGDLTPADVTPHTARKIAWRCPCGCEWTAQIKQPPPRIRLPALPPRPVSGPDARTGCRPVADAQSVDGITA